jgi:hypothetical protein
MKGRRIALVALLALAGGAGVWLIAARTAPSASGASSAPERAGSPEPRLAMLENSLRAIEEGVREAPRDRWDPAYVVEHIGRDPDSLAAWVSENTSWIPYRGALRGPVGVLMDRQGNSLDRALLLSALLAEAGHTARLAHDDLPPERAAELLPSLVARRAVGVFAELASTPLDAPSVSVAASRYGLDRPEIERVLNEYEKGTTRLLAELDRRVPEQAGRLIASIPAPDPNAEWLSRRDSAIAALGDHWWVQVQRGDSWLDLDVLGATASGAGIVPRETISPSHLPPALHHVISIRVIAERLAAGALTEQAVLAHTIRPSELIGRPVVLQFWPAAWPNRAPAVEDLNRSTRRIASSQDTWTAALVIGSDVVASGGLSAAGAEVEAAAAPAPGFGGLGGAISQGLNGRRGPVTSGQDSLLTAAWIEYRLDIPGREPRVVRRAVFDLVGEAARQARAPHVPTLSDEQRLTRALSLMMRTEILPVVARPAPEFVLQLHGRSLLANADLLRAVSRASFGSNEHTVDSLLRLAEPAVSPLYALAVLRRGALGEAGMVDRPAILTRHQFPKIHGEGLALEDATDIVANELGIALTESDGFAARLEQGVWDTNLEAFLAGSRASVNTALAYAASGDWRTLTAAQSGRTPPGMAPDAAALMRRDLESGYTVIAPDAPIALRGDAFGGWWRIDPATGDALGIAATGWGQGAPDYTMHLAVFVEMAKPFVFAYALCQYIPQAANSLNILGNEFWRIGLSPSWTTRPDAGKDFEDVAVENNRMCVIEAILAGFVSTAPLLRGMFARAEAELAAEARYARRPITMASAPATPGTSPRPQGYPAPSGPATSGRGPGGTLPGGARPPADPFGKTEPGIRPTRPGPPPIRTRPGPPPTPRPTPPARPMTPEAAREKLNEAIAARDQASRASFEATRDYVQYRNNMPNPGRGHAGDPAKWDPRPNSDLQKRMWDKQQEAIERINAWKDAERELTNARVAANRAAGRSGLAPANQAPPPAPAPKPVGNENPTVPQQAVAMPGSPSGGALEAGSAGVSSSLSPGSDP